MFYSNAREIWEDLAATYSMRQDISRCYELETKIFGVKLRTLYFIILWNVEGYVD